MAKRDSRVPKTRSKPAKVLPQHQSLAGPSVNRIPFPNGEGSNIQHVPSRGSFSVNDHKIMRVRPGHSPTEE
jgi:hypothetical protein